MLAEIQKRMHAFEASWPEQRQLAWVPAELRSSQLPTDELPRWPAAEAQRTAALHAVETTAKLQFDVQ